MGTYFHEGALDHENHENFCLVKISCYVVFNNYCWVYSLIKACYYVGNGLAGLYHGKGLKSRGCQASLSNTVTHLLWSMQLPVVVLLILRMVRKENVDPDLRVFQPPKKKAKITRELGAQFKCRTSNEEMATLKGFVPVNTQTNNVRGMRVFLEWRAQRNRAISVKVQQCPENLRDNSDCQKLNFWLSWFVAEVRTTLASKDHPSDFVSFTKEKKVEKHPQKFPYSLRMR